MIWSNLFQVFIENDVALICNQYDIPSSYPKRLPKYFICILEIGSTFDNFLVYALVKKPFLVWLIIPDSHYFACWISDFQLSLHCQVYFHWWANRYLFQFLRCIFFNKSFFLYFFYEGRHLILILRLPWHLNWLLFEVKHVVENDLNMFFIYWFD